MNGTKLPLNRYYLFGALALGGAFADLISKHYVFEWLGMPGPGKIHWVIKDFFAIETATNPGALFGLGAGYAFVFSGLAVVAIIAIGLWLFAFRAAIDIRLTVALGVITGGIIGNLYDRLGLWSHSAGLEEPVYQVRDWILFCYGYDHYRWPNFNIADCLLFCGACYLFWYSFRYPNGADKER
ncbi:MAG: signal peptidase II [Pirellulaceae bacterium]|nr:signal peptidase II [Pirellulaceae bacterium]